VSVIDAAELEALLRANGFLTVERPPQLWGLETTELEPFVRCLGELIAAGLFRNGNDLSRLVLNVANVVDEDEAHYVALSIRGPGEWSPEVAWTPGSEVVLAGNYLTAAAAEAGAVRGYTRDLGDGSGAVTLWFTRSAG